MRQPTDTTKRDAFLATLKRGKRKHVSVQPVLKQAKSHEIHINATLFSCLWCAFGNWCVIAPIGNYKRKQTIVIGERFGNGELSMDSCLTGMIWWVQHYSDTECLISFDLISRKRGDEIFDKKGNKISQ